MTDLSTTERFLCLFTEVKPGEGSTAVMMFANVFLILLAYYFIKPLREGWISVSEVSGLTKMEVRAYSSFGQSLVLVPIVAGYSHLVNRWDRAKLITVATLSASVVMGTSPTLTPTVKLWSSQTNRNSSAARRRALATRCACTKSDASAAKYASPGRLP